MTTPPGMAMQYVFIDEKPDSIPILPLIEGYWKIYVISEGIPNRFKEGYWEFTICRIHTRANQFIAIHRKHGQADGVVMTSGFRFTDATLIEVTEGNVLWWRLIITVESATERYNISMNLVSFETCR